MNTRQKIINKVNNILLEYQQDKVTKYTVLDHVEQCFKKLGVQYKFESNNSSEILFRLRVPLECYVHVQYDLFNEQDEEVCIHFYSRISERSRTPLYTVTWCNDQNNDDIEGEIYELVNYTKNIYKVLKPIKSSINKILNICDEHGLDWQEFISVNFDFN